MTSRAMENEMMVAALLGISPEEASQLLDKTAYVSGGGAGSAGQLAEAVRANLGRTIHLAEAGSSCDIEVVLGGACVTNAAHKIYVDMRGRALSLSYEDREGREVEEVHPLKVEIAACYIASSVLSTILDVPDAPRGDLEVVFEKLGLFDEMLRLPVCLEDAVLLGAGAVGNGFLRGLRHIDVRGRLTVIDPKNVRNGNLNRCLYFSELDEELPKALQLALRAQADFGGLVLEPLVGDFAAYMRSAKRVRRVIVAVDTRDARRRIQDAAPLEVIDASTTEAKEVIVYSHVQPTRGACLACIYKLAPEESSRKRDIAASLGISAEDIEGELIDEAVAAKIVLARPELSSQKLVGTAFETLFKGLCGMDVVRTDGGKQVLAPFAFVSNLAGVMQVIELLRLEAFPHEEKRGNYFYMSPWSPPNVRARKFRKPDGECRFCSDPAMVDGIRALWSDVLEERGGS